MDLAARESAPRDGRPRAADVSGPPPRQIEERTAILGSGATEAAAQQPVCDLVRVWEAHRAGVALPRPPRVPRHLRPRKRFWVRSRGTLVALIALPFAVVGLAGPPPFAPGSGAALACGAVAWSLFAAGALVRWTATLYIGGRKGYALTSDGPYALCRNPLYLGNVLLILALAAWLAAALFALGIALALAVYLAITVGDEERRLAERHGADFEAYCRAVPRYWPRPGNWHSPAQLVVDVRCMGLELRRTLIWIWIPLIGQAGLWLRTAPWWPDWN